MPGSASAIRLVSHSLTAEFIGLDPTYAYERQGQLVKHEHRATDGKMYTYRVSSWFRFEVPLTFVNSSDRSQINSWWGAGSNLRLYEDVQNFSNSYFLVRIVNDEEPLTRFEEPLYNQLWRGDLVLETYS